jgi:serine/threonine-protein kinase HipA
MKQADVFVNDIKAGQLIEYTIYEYEFKYQDNYKGFPVSLTMPVSGQQYKFSSFPAFFEGLLPEGTQLEALLKDKKINRNDYFTQLVACGADCVGAVTVRGVL